MLAVAAPGKNLALADHDSAPLTFFEVGQLERLALEVLRIERQIQDPEAQGEPSTVGLILFPEVRQEVNAGLVVVLADKQPRRSSAPGTAAGPWSAEESLFAAWQGSRQAFLDSRSQDSAGHQHDRTLQRNYGEPLPTHLLRVARQGDLWTSCMLGRLPRSGSITLCFHRPFTVIGLRMRMGRFWIPGCGAVCRGLPAGRARHSSKVCLGCSGPFSRLHVKSWSCLAHSCSKLCLPCRWSNARQTLAELLAAHSRLAVLRSRALGG